MTQRSAGLPSPQQVTELLADEFARAGYEVDAVVIDSRTRRITVTADGDEPLDLDTAAELSRAASTLLDDLDTGDEAYFPGSHFAGSRPAADSRETLSSGSRTSGRHHSG